MELRKKTSIIKMFYPKPPKIHPQQKSNKTKNGKIQETTEQIKNLFVLMLQDLRQIYARNGIDHQVNSQLTNLIRLLTPLSLLPHFNTIQYQAKLEEAQEFEARVQERNFKQNIGFADKGDYLPYYQSSKQDLKLIPGAYLQNQVQDPKKMPKQCSKANKRYYYRDRTKPILRQETEEELVEWIMQKLSNNERIRRKDIAKKAFELNNNENGFGGSLGWVNRFLLRHPGVKDLMYARSNLTEQQNSQYNNVSSEIGMEEIQSFDGQFGGQESSKPQIQDKNQGSILNSENSNSVRNPKPGK